MVRARKTGNEYGFRLGSRVLRWTAIVFLFLLAGIFSTQAQPPATWIGIYGGPFDEMGKTVILPTTGGLLSAGWTRSFGDLHGDLYLLRTNGGGDSLWAVSYGGLGLDKAKEVVECPTGGFMVAGYSESDHRNERQGYLLRLDDFGEVIWWQMLGGSGRDGFFDLVLLADSTWLAVGDYQTDAPDEHRNGWLVRFNGLGDIIWERYLGTDRDTRLFTGCQLSDGTIVCAGWGRPGAGYEPDIQVYAVDNDGNLLWEQMFGSNLFDIARRVRPTSDGGFILAGEVELLPIFGAEQAVVAKLDNAGNVLWGYCYGGLWVDQVSGLAVDEDDTAYIVGSTDVNALLVDDVALLLISPAGQPFWYDTFGSPRQDVGRGIVLGPDGEIYLTGQTGYRVNDSGYDLFLARLDGIGGQGAPPPMLQSLEQAGIDVRR